MVIFKLFIDLLNSVQIIKKNVTTQLNMHLIDTEYELFLIGSNIFKSLLQRLNLRNVTLLQIMVHVRTCNDLALAIDEYSV